MTNLCASAPLRARNVERAQEGAPSSTAEDFARAIRRASCGGRRAAGPRRFADAGAEENPRVAAHPRPSGAARRRGPEVAEAERRTTQLATGPLNLGRRPWRSGGRARRPARGRRAPPSPRRLPKTLSRFPSFPRRGERLPDLGGQGQADVHVAQVVATVLDEIAKILPPRRVLAERVVVEHASPAPRRSPRSAGSTRRVPIRRGRRPWTRRRRPIPRHKTVYTC